MRPRSNTSCVCFLPLGKEQIQFSTLFKEERIANIFKVFMRWKCWYSQHQKIGVLVRNDVLSCQQKSIGLNFLSAKPEVTCGTVAIIIRVILLSPYLRIRAVSLSSIHYNQSHRVYVNRRRQYICLI